MLPYLASVNVYIENICRMIFDLNLGEGRFLLLDSILDREFSYLQMPDAPHAFAVDHSHGCA